MKVSSLIVPSHPKVPYAFSGSYQQWSTENYRYKISSGASRIAHGQQKCLYVGDLSEVRNWRGDSTTVREFVQMSFANMGIEVAFSGKNEYEKGVIIDVDFDLAHEQGVNTDKIHFGNTVVRVGT